MIERVQLAEHREVEHCILITFDATDVRRVLPRPPLPKGGMALMPVGTVATRVSEALQRTFPAVKFTVRYRTSHTYRPSWVEVRWRAGPAEGEVNTVIAGVLERVRP